MLLEYSKEWLGKVSWKKNKPVFLANNSWVMLLLCSVLLLHFGKIYALVQPSNGSEETQSPGSNVEYEADVLTWGISIRVPVSSSCPALCHPTNQISVFIICTMFWRDEGKGVVSSGTSWCDTGGTARITPQQAHMDPTKSRSVASKALLQNTPGAFSFSVINHRCQHLIQVLSKT